MADQIQGRDVTVKLYQNGRCIKNFPVKKFDWEAEQEFKKRNLLGKKRPSRKLIIEGYKGSLEFDVEDGAHHEIAALLNAADNSGLAGPKFAIQLKEKYTSGDSKVYRFTNAKFKVPKENIGSDKDDVTGTIEWEAEDITYQ